MFIIAEIGNTHEGSIGLAKNFIKAVQECGANAVKFQVHIFESESLPFAPNPPYFKDESRKDYFNRTSFSIDEWKALKIYAEEDCGLEFMASPFSEDAVDLLENLNVKTYKIASGEVTNIPMLKKIATLKKSVLLSSGMSSWAELDLAVNCLLSNGCSDLTLLQCTSEYPCLPKDSGLNIIDELKSRYPHNKVGYSDHTLGTAIAIAAVCKGATVIEKHFTLSKKMYGSDAQFSCEPDEFKNLVDSLHSVFTGLNSVVDKDSKASSLTEMKKTFEKMIVAKCDLEEGLILNEADLSYKKPMDGIPANEYLKVIGKKLTKPVKKNCPLRYEYLD